MKGKFARRLLIVPSVNCVLRKEFTIKMALVEKWQTVIESFNMLKLKFVAAIVGVIAGFTVWMLPGFSLHNWLGFMAMAACSYAASHCYHKLQKQ